ncbi:type II secretion system F family protein [Coleofasciculus sp. FACHB-64]|uniref:type II secretion system F family protein n=1 Tax=Cyanophyceae TaxID=3028117 RepID=UPI001688B1E1|nr:type II secretion system F family protein [Coleofasciculus sp. FACHB-501]MBD2046219.1 type II secretion system F family protein [Coleofasciculus sp. FACHB-64]
MNLHIKLKNQEKAQFFQQFATLLNSGISVQQSLNLVERDRNSPFGRYLQTVSVAVDSGQDLASALTLDARYFDGWTISLIRLAEYSGSLAETFERLATAAEAKAKRQRLYRSVGIAAISLIWSLLVLAAALFKRNPQKLTHPGFWLCSFGLALLLVGVAVLNSRFPGRGLQRLAAQLPGLDKVMQARSLLYFTELSLPLSCGVTILAALELLRDRIPDPQMATHVAKAARQIRLGRSLTESLQTKLPPLAIQYIRTGEETGNLDAALRKLEQYYQSDLEKRLRQLEGILRPLSLLAIGGLVLLVAIRAINSLINSLPG